MGASVGAGISVGVCVGIGVGVTEAVGVEVEVGIGVGVGRIRFSPIFLSAKIPPSPCIYRRRIIWPSGIPLRSQV